MITAIVCKGNSYIGLLMDDGMMITVRVCEFGDMQDSGFAERTKRDRLAAVIGDNFHVTPTKIVQG